MAQLVKYIVGELNKPPFNLNFTNVTFNALQPPQLLQVNLSSNSGILLVGYLLLYGSYMIAAS